MFAITKDNYEQIFKSLNLLLESKEKIIDVYHKNNWNQFTIHWDEESKNACPSYIDFFFDAKSMVDFLKQFLEKENFEKCYMAPICSGKYKLKLFDDDVCRDVFDEFKKIINSLGLKVNTSKAIQMDKEEFLKWCDRFSVGGFCGVAEHSVIIPELNLIIIPHHHMNYLIYSNNKKAVLSKLFNIKTDELLIE